jgi:hypothetical protein
MGAERSCPERDDGIDDRLLAALVLVVVSILLIATLPLARESERPALVRTQPAASPAEVNR